MSVGDNSDNDLPPSPPSEQKPDGDKFAAALLVLAKGFRDQSQANRDQSAANAQLVSMIQVTAGAQGYTFSSNHVVTPNSQRTQLPIDERSNLHSSTELSLPNQDLVTTSTTATTAQLPLNPPTIQRNSAPDEDLHQSSAAAAAAAAPPTVAATDVLLPAAADMHQIVPSASAGPPSVAATNVPLPPPAASPGANVCPPTLTTAGDFGEESESKDEEQSVDLLCGKTTGHESEDERHEDIPPSIDVEISSSAKKSRGDDPLRQSSFSAVAQPPPESTAAISNKKRKSGTDTNGAAPTKLHPFFTRMTKKQKKNTADDSGGDGGGDEVLMSGGDEPCGHQEDSGGDGGGDEVLKSGGDEPCGHQEDSGGDGGGDEDLQAKYLSKFVKKDGKSVPLKRLCITCKTRYKTSAVKGGKHCITCAKNQGLEITQHEPCAARGCQYKVKKRGYCLGHQFMVESDRQNRVKAANALLKSASIQLPARFEKNVHALSMLEQSPPPGFDILFEQFQQCVAAFEEDMTEENHQNIINAYNACIDLWEGVTFSHPPRKPVPPPQIGDVNTFSGPSRVQAISGYNRIGQPTGVICSSGIPTGEDVVRGAAANGCRFGDLTMFADMPPEFYCEIGHCLKPNQIEIAMSTGVVFRGTVDEPSNELCIRCFGISERDAHINDPEERAKFKLDDYKNAPKGGSSVHQYIAAAFGLDRTSTGGIDHLNRVRSDNRVVNLYSATAKEQNDNRSSVISYSK